MTGQLGLMIPIYQLICLWCIHAEGNLMKEPNGRSRVSDTLQARLLSEDYHTTSDLTIFFFSFHKAHYYHMMHFTTWFVLNASRAVGDAQMWPRLENVSQNFHLKIFIYEFKSLNLCLTWSKLSDPSSKLGDCLKQVDFSFLRSYAENHVNDEEILCCMSCGN